MVSNRLGNGFGLKKQWALASQHLPQWHPHATWDEQELVAFAATRSLTALGVGTARHIKNHFIRGRYPGLAAGLDNLVEQGRILPVKIRENGAAWPDKWYINADSVQLLDDLGNGEWRPRLTLLSPFDNLICDRDRTELMFGFRYRSEIYTPKAKRQYGYYVMPILSGDTLIGRIDPKLDRKKKTLRIHAVHLEPGVKESAELKAGINGAVSELATFLGATDIQFS